MIIVVSGVVAYIGNYIGRSIGRKRLSIFKLRPRYTAMVFTVLTGIAIALLTMLVILMVSRDARTALFGLDQLKSTLQEQKQLIQNNQNEIEKTNLELNTAKKQLADIKRVKQKLEKEIQQSRQGTVLFKLGDVLITSVMKAGPEKNKLGKGLEKIISAADAYVRELGVSSKEHLIYIAPKNFNAALDQLMLMDNEAIIKVKAAQNTLFGEQVKAELEVIDNTLLYPKGLELAQIKIDPKISQPEIEQQIKILLAMAHKRAKTDGMLTNASGSVGSIAYTEIASVAKKIKLNKASATVKATAKKDIYLIGPLEVSLNIYYQ